NMSWTCPETPKNARRAQKQVVYVHCPCMRPSNALRRFSASVDACAACIVHRCDVGGAVAVARRTHQGGPCGAPIHLGHGAARINAAPGAPGARARLPAAALRAR